MRIIPFVAVIAAVGLASCNGPAIPGQAPAMPPSANVKSDGSSACATAGCLYVASFYKGATLNMYALDGKLRVPVTRVYGKLTHLDQPMGLALDAAGNVYVTNANSVNVYGASTFGHNDKPAQHIAGGKTGLDYPRGIAVDASGDIYVANDASRSFRPDSITVYAPGATGNVKPIREIRGIRTGLVRPSGIAIDAAGNLYVANGSNSYGPGTIAEFAPGADGNALPVSSIGGSNTQLSDNISALALDGSGNLYVANDAVDDTNVTIYAQGASGNVAPIHAISGSSTGLANLNSLAVDTNGDVFAGCSEYDGIVYEFAAGSYGDVSATREIDGFYKPSRLKPNIYGLTVR